MTINLPEEVHYIIDTLESKGFEGYAVGGCIRDSLLGAEPKDWDVCTPMLPLPITECFRALGHHVIETGLKHGTVTLMLDGKAFEITTYRVDGKYKDNRRPDTVKFVDVLKRDLARRDFTINAMAYSPKTGIVDYYNGACDLCGRKIKCVGNPDKRFGEDALRIMRAMRFASTLGFEIEENTARAMFDNRSLLKNIAGERIAAELDALLTGDGACDILAEHVEVLAAVIPELLPMSGFEQHNPHHCYDVWGHTLCSVGSVEKDATLRLTMLFHDIGKPQCFTRSQDGIGHFYGHQLLGADIARDILKRLKYDNDTINTVTELIKIHDCDIKGTKSIKRWLNKIGEQRFRQLLEVKKADVLAQAQDVQAEKLEKLAEIRHKTGTVIDGRQCFSLKDLAVNGRDIMNAGLAEGPAIGEVLRRLLDMVIDGEVKNEKGILLKTAKGFM